MLYRLWLMTEPQDSVLLAVALDYAKEWGLYLHQIDPGWMWGPKDAVVLGNDADVWDVPVEIVVCPFESLEEFVEDEGLSMRRRRYCFEGVRPS
jgi:hypothetical protein